MLIFTVPGNPVPKQSFRYVRGGRSYQSPRVRAWQEKISWHALNALANNGLQRFEGPVKIWLEFYRENERPVDIDNLQKCALDGIKHVAIGDDAQVVNIQAMKHVCRKHPRLEVTIQQINQQELKELQKEEIDVRAYILRR